MFQYYCLNPISNVGLEKFTDNYNKTDNIEEAEGVLVRSAAMHDMELPANLLAVARAGAGVNNIPLDKCAEKGIVVFNTPGANANGVKELVIAGMLLAARDVVGGIEWVKENQNDENIAKTAEKAKSSFAGRELTGKKLGIIGLGAIGVKVANTARHFGMEVYGYDPYVSVDAAWNLSRDVKHVLNVEDIYKTCDYITIHVPLLDSTKGMIDKNAIDMMKDGVVILNFARDLLANEADVLAALESGKVHKYVTDFPNPTTAGKKGCIVIPHLGASTEESEDNCAKMAVKEMMDYLENGNIKNSVNFPNVELSAEGERVGVIHHNALNVMNDVLGAFMSNGVETKEFGSKAKGDFAYTLVVADKIPDAVVKALEANEDVIKVRKI